MKIVPITTDNRDGFSLSGAPPNPPALPGEEIAITSDLQIAVPICFVRLVIGQDDRVLTLGPSGIVSRSSLQPGAWRVEEIKIDDVPGLIGVGHLGIGQRAFVRATNIGTEPAYFYGTWECEDIH